MSAAGTNWITDLRRDFDRVFSSSKGRTHVIRAPGRVNLIGEHTDYNDGFVFPMAIEPEIRFVCRSREDGQVRLTSTEMGQKESVASSQNSGAGSRNASTDYRLLDSQFSRPLASFSLNEKIVPLDKHDKDAWTNYPRGAIAELIAAGIPLSGMDVLLTSSIPLGGGLSSSAALLVGTARCALALAGLTMDPQRLALLCQKAEHEYAGAPVGIMDQTIIAAARAGTAMLLDCRDLSKRFVPLDAQELRVVVANSLVKHDLGAGGDNEYAKRRRQCEEAVRFFATPPIGNPAVKSLRDVTLQQIDQAKGKLDDVVLRRARHVVTETARTARFAELLAEKKYEQAGDLMLQSHASMRDDYEITVEEVDFLSAEAMKVKGVYGARMTGGGFGGCIVALVQPRAATALIEHLTRGYADRFGKRPECFVTTAADGASIVA